MANSVTEIANLIIAKVLTGGRRTTAQFVRDVLNAMKDSYLNLKDGGLNVEVEAGYKTQIVPTDPKSFPTKKYVDDAVAAGGGGGASAVTQTITCNGSTTLFNYTVAHGGNGVIWSMKAGQDGFYDQFPTVTYPDNNTVRVDISTLDFSNTKVYKFKYIL